MTSTEAGHRPNSLAVLAPLAARLSKASQKDRYNVRGLFTWPAAIPDEEHWFSPELSTCYGSETWEMLDPAARRMLTRLELRNFFSASVDVERELVAEVAARIYTPRFAAVSDFLYDFLAEENDHMWMFSEFCTRYAGGSYATGWHALTPPGDAPSETSDLVLFGRILIAEEVSDWYNRRLAADDRLPEIIRTINQVHHKDESRHIAFGRRLVTVLAENAGPEGRRTAGDYLARYIDLCVGTLYNPLVYRDAGIDHPARVRRTVRDSTARRRIDEQLTARTRRFLTSIEVFGDSNRAGSGSNRIDVPGGR